MILGKHVFGGRYPQLRLTFYGSGKIACWYYPLHFCEDGANDP